MLLYDISYISTSGDIRPDYTMNAPSNSRAMRGQDTDWRVCRCTNGERHTVLVSPDGDPVALDLAPAPVQVTAQQMGVTK